MAGEGKSPLLAICRYSRAVKDQGSNGALKKSFLALLCLVWVAGHSDLTQVVMGSPDRTTNGEVGSWVNLPATR